MSCGRHEPVAVLDEARRVALGVGDALGVRAAPRAHRVGDLHARGQRGRGGDRSRRHVAGGAERVVVVRDDRRLAGRPAAVPAVAEAQHAVGGREREDAVRPRQLGLARLRRRARRCAARARPRRPRRAGRRSRATRARRRARRRAGARCRGRPACAPAGPPGRAARCRCRRARRSRAPRWETVAALTPTQTIRALLLAGARRRSQVTTRASSSGSCRSGGSSPTPASSGSAPCTACSPR